ncbi:MAG: DUF1330 domain-containing protein [Sneathiella sp.]|nr:DUF1330 domain-containing protein [Sneathiella sp.]
MKHYTIVEFTVKNTDWISEYAEVVTNIVERMGGKYLARTSDVDAMEGNIVPGTTSVIIEWPSKDLAMSFYNSDEYKPYLESRLSATMGTLMIVAGKDDSHQSQL